MAVKKLCLESDLIHLIKYSVMRCIRNSVFYYYPEIWSFICLFQHAGLSVSRKDSFNSLHQSKRPWKNVNMGETEDSEQGNPEWSIGTCGKSKARRNSVLKWGLPRSLLGMIKNSIENYSQILQWMTESFSALSLICVSALMTILDGVHCLVESHEIRKYKSYSCAHCRRSQLFLCLQFYRI